MHVSVLFVDDVITECNMNIGFSLDFSGSVPLPDRVKEVKFAEGLYHAIAIRSDAATFVPAALVYFNKFAEKQWEFNECQDVQCVETQFREPTVYENSTFIDCLIEQINDYRSEQCVEIRPLNAFPSGQVSQHVPQSVRRDAMVAVEVKCCLTYFASVRELLYSTLVNNENLCLRLGALLSFHSYLLLGFLVD